MQRLLKIYLTVIVLVVLFDVVGSIASRLLLFDYTKLFWMSWCIYFIAGFVGYRRLGFLSGAAAGLIAGLGDATFGWFLSSAIGPYLPNRTQQQYGIVIVIITIVIVTILGAFFGLVGALVSKLLSRGRSSTRAEQALAPDAVER